VVVTESDRVLEGGGLMGAKQTNIGLNRRGLGGNNGQHHKRDVYDKAFDQDNEVGEGGMDLCHWSGGGWHVPEKVWVKAVM